MHDVFHVLLLKQDTTSKKQVDIKDVTELDTNKNDNRKYKVESIHNSAIYAKKSMGHLLRLYYLVF